MPSTHLPRLGKEWPGRPMQSLWTANTTVPATPTVGDVQRSVCGRQCERYDSFVILAHDGQGGLTDRIRIMAGATLMATSVCARVVVPPPSQWLTTLHNNGRPVDPSFWWDRYIEIGQLSDGHAIIAHPDEVPEYEQTFGPTPWYEVGDDYELARGLSNSAFAWTISDSYYRWYESLPSLESTCGVPIPSVALLKKRPEVWGFPQSYRIQGVAEQVKTRLTAGRAPEILHTLYVRRGDPVGTSSVGGVHCKTEDVPYVARQSLECDSGRKNKSKIGVLLFTNQTDHIPTLMPTDVLLFFTDQTDQASVGSHSLLLLGEARPLTAASCMAGVHH